MTHVIGAPVWSAKGRRPYIGSFLLFTLSLVASGGGSGWVFGSVAGGRPTAINMIALAVACALFLAREIWGRNIPLLQIRAQVPAYLRGHLVLAPVVYGAMLGAGVLTRIPSSLFYIYAAAVIALATPSEGFVVGMVFGLTYALGVLGLGHATQRSDPGQQATRVSGVIEAIRRPTTIAAATAIVGLTVVVH